MFLSVYNLYFKTLFLTKGRMLNFSQVRGLEHLPVQRIRSPFRHATRTTSLETQGKLVGVGESQSDWGKNVKEKLERKQGDPRDRVLPPQFKTALWKLASDRVGKNQEKEASPPKG